MQALLNMQEASNAKVESSIRQAHSRLNVAYETVSSHVSEMLEGASKKNGWLYKGRIKSLESYALKILTGRTESYEIDDFFACSIIVPNLREVSNAYNLVESCFKIVEVKPSATIRYRPTEFNYDSLRLYCKLSSVNEEKKNESIFEIQIKTLLEHAWSEVTHDFSYKSQTISWGRERFAAQLRAALNNIDIAIHSMEDTSKLDFLNKKNENYEELQKVLNFILEKFNKNHNIPLPNDLKRLTEEVNRLIKQVNISMTDIDTYLENETQLGRGYKTVNLSIYSIILLAIYNQGKDNIVKYLRRYKSGKPKIVIPKEVGITKESFTDSNLDGLVFL